MVLLLLAAVACSSGSGEPIALLEYDATVPASFVARPATSSMRLAEWSVSRTDDASAEVIVYYFGEGQGGSADANIARWSSQFTSAEGGPVTPRVGTLDGTAFVTTVAEFEGAYARSVGMGGVSAEPDQALVAAVVETPRGNLFLQLFGDRVAVAEAREDFLEMVGSIR
ncbi:MAG: hypothetical protein K0S65_4410 [Labilithrix sp.]|jgi:hypothetical protein|nr:hypothetical protein [Labilithrix sp.]